MAEDDDLIGPIDYVLIGFPGGISGDEAATELLALVDSGVIRIYDFVVIGKDAEGSVAALVLEELPPENVGAFMSFLGASSGLVGDSDIAEAAAVMEPDSTAVLIVFENVWAARFARAARKAGGELLAYDRIPVQAILDALDEVEAAG